MWKIEEIVNQRKADNRQEVRDRGGNRRGRGKEMEAPRLALWYGGCSDQPGQNNTGNTR